MATAIGEVGERKGTSSHAPLADPDKPVVPGIAGLLTVVGLLFTVALRLADVAAAIALVVGLAGLAMLEFRRRDRRFAEASKWKILRASGWDRRMMILSLVIVLAGVVPGLFSGIAQCLWEHLVGQHNDRVWPFRGIALSLVAIAATVHLSAMVDWTLIRPRLLGSLTVWNMPCQARRDERSSNWALWTRVWLGHRLAAYVIVRVSLAVCIGFGAAAIIHPGALSEQSAAPRGGSATPSRPPATATTRTGPDQQQTTPGSADDGTAKKDWVQPVGTILGAMAAAILVFFINRMLPVWSLLTNPRLDVGDRVVLAEEYGTGVEDRPEYYVVDVSIEGIKLLLLDRRGSPTGTVVFRRDRAGAVLVDRPRRGHDRSLELADVPRLMRTRTRFTGCDVRCSGAYHDCPVKTGCQVAVEKSQAEVEAYTDRKSRWWVLQPWRSAEEGTGNG